jgi:hypothetical protein
MVVSSSSAWVGDCLRACGVLTDGISATAKGHGPQQPCAWTRTLVGSRAVVNVIIDVGSPYTEFACSAFGANRNAATEPSPACSPVFACRLQKIDSNNISRLPRCLLWLIAALAHLQSPPRYSRRPDSA